MADQPSSAPTPVLLVIGIAGFLLIVSGFAFTFIAGSQPTRSSEPVAIATEGSRVLPEADEPGTAAAPQETKKPLRPQT